MERREKTSYYFKHKPGEVDKYLLIRRISFGKNIVSYQSIEEFTAQERGSLRLLKKKIHKGRITEMIKNKAGQYSLELVLNELNT